jgi:hypothetical protein
MEKYFLPYELALALKELGLDEPCFGFYYEEEFELNVKGDTLDIIPKKFNSCFVKETKHFQKLMVSAPLYQQVIDWFEKEHNIFIGKTCYDDSRTPKRWVYHVDNYYVQEQSYDGAIRYAINKIKNTQS